ADTASTRPHAKAWEGRRHAPTRSEWLRLAGHPARAGRPALPARGVPVRVALRLADRGVPRAESPRLDAPGRARRPLPRRAAARASRRAGLPRGPARLPHVPRRLAPALDGGRVRGVVATALVALRARGDPLGRRGPRSDPLRAASRRRGPARAAR